VHLNKKIITLFRIIAFLEGTSYLLLLFVGVPFKYLNGNDYIVKLLGMPHGLLFVAYIFIAIYLGLNQDWSFRKKLIVLASSVIPFGTFYVEFKYLRSKTKKRN
jgi:integral membrane protein